jgi:hypothetical protein
MVRMKDVTLSGGGDYQDPPRPFRQDKGKDIYLQQQGGKKKRNLDKATRAAVAARGADRAEQGGQLRIASNQILYGSVLLVSDSLHSCSDRPLSPSHLYHSTFLHYASFLHS